MRSPSRTFSVDAGGRRKVCRSDIFSGEEKTYKQTNANTTVAVHSTAPIGWQAAHAFIQDASPFRTSTFQAQFGHWQLHTIRPDNFFSDGSRGSFLNAVSECSGDFHIEPSMGGVKQEVNEAVGMGTKLRYATANVMTLHPHQKSRSYAQVSGICLQGKVTMLEMQFFHHQLDVIGVQEGRSLATEQTDGQHCSMLASTASADGALGVQL